MAAPSVRRTLPSHALGACLPLILVALLQVGAAAQTVTPASARITAAPPTDRATPAWTLKLKQDIRWQQVTPAGTLL